MQDEKKGFDPLASLFDAPDPHFDTDVSYDSMEESVEQSIEDEEISLDVGLDAPMLTEEFEAKETQEVNKEELAKALAQAAMKQRPPAESRAEELAARSKQPMSVE